MVPYNLSIALWDIYPREMKNYVHTKPAHEFHSSFIQNNQKLETPQMALEWVTG